MIAVIISANSEWRAALEYLDPASPLHNPYSEHFFSEMDGKAVVFLHGGWGKISAAATAQFCIDTWHPEVIINLGTCGGLARAITAGETLLVNETVSYDIYERMGDPEAAIRFYSTKLDLSFIMQPYPPTRASGQIGLGRSRHRPEAGTAAARPLSCRRRGLGIRGDRLGGTAQRRAVLDFAHGQRRGQ
jgi:adenosylhomocysteine nucleosidase